MQLCHLFYPKNDLPDFRGAFTGQLRNVVDENAEIFMFFTFDTTLNQTGEHKAQFSESQRRSC